MSEPTLPPSPLSEANPRALEDVMSARPPFAAHEMQMMIAELRRMRVKWQVEEREGVKKKGKKVSGPAPVVSDIFGGDDSE